MGVRRVDHLGDALPLVLTYLSADDVYRSAALACKSLLRAADSDAHWRLRCAALQGHVPSLPSCVNSYKDLCIRYLHNLIAGGDCSSSTVSEGPWEVFPGSSLQWLRPPGVHSHPLVKGCFATAFFFGFLQQDVDCAAAPHSLPPEFLRAPALSLQLRFWHASGHDQGSDIKFRLQFRGAAPFAHSRTVRPRQGSLRWHEVTAAFEVPPQWDGWARFVWEAADWRFAQNEEAGGAKITNVSLRLGLGAAGVAEGAVELPAPAGG